MTAASLSASPAASLARHPALPWLLSLLIAAAGTLAVFPLPVLLGTAPFWENPHGIAGESWGDMLQATSGYGAFVRDAWRWPLFDVAGLGPHGANIIFTDSVPGVALLGRLLFRVTGQAVPLYGLWSGLCVGGMALAFTGLVRALGGRGCAAATMAAAAGASMPALLARWGHIALMGQALVPLALLAYVRLRAAPRLHPGRVFCLLAALCVGSLLVHPYLMLMAAGIAGAAVLQAGTDRRLPRWHAALVLAALAAAGAGAMWAMGYGRPGSAASDVGYGRYSANLLSLVLPYSGAAPGLDAFTVDGTGGQYEGMAFLGAGVLILAMLARRGLAATLRAGPRRHPWLLAFVAACAVFAVSNQVYAGPWHLGDVPLPDGALRVAGLLRAGGRFIWVPACLLSALAIAAAARRRDAVFMLLLAAAVQWMGATTWRRAIGDSVAARPPSVLDHAAWQAALRGADALVVDPPFACIPDGPLGERRKMAAIELQLLAVQARVPTNTIYAARILPDCTVPLPGPRTLLVRLRPPAPEGDLAVASAMPCAAGPLAGVCGLLPGTGALGRLLPLAKVPKVQ